MIYDVSRSTSEALNGWLTCLRKSLLKRLPRGGGGGSSSIRSGGVSPSSLNTFSSLKHSISIIWKRNSRMRQETQNNQCVYVDIASPTSLRFFFSNVLNSKYHTTKIQKLEEKTLAQILFRTWTNFLSVFKKL